MAEPEPEPEPSPFIIIPPEEDEMDPMSLPSILDGLVATVNAEQVNIRVIGFGNSRRLFLGVEIQLPGVLERHSVHAVQFLVTNLILNSETFLRYLAVHNGLISFRAPCNHCRLFLEEFHNAPDVKILVTDDYENQYVNLESLYQYHINNSFPDNYRHLFIHARYNYLTFLVPDSHAFCIDANCVNLKCRALAAANRSYAPYSDCPSGVALMDSAGNVYVGWYLESVTSNTSLGPLQVALVDFVTRSNGRGFHEIEFGVLVEKSVGSVRQEDTMRMIFHAITGRYSLYVFNCQ